MAKVQRSHDFIHIVKHYLLYKKKEPVLQIDPLLFTVFFQQKKQNETNFASKNARFSLVACSNSM